MITFLPSNQEMAVFKGITYYIGSTSFWWSIQIDGAQPAKVTALAYCTMMPVKLRALADKQWNWGIVNTFPI
jgi:hypothetical protein